MVSTFQGKPLTWNYINLSHRPERSDRMLKEFQKHGITASRFEAYRPGDWDGDAFDVRYMMGVGPAGRPGTPGAVGCYMSQLAIIKSAIGTDSVVAVCEDDVYFCEDLEKRINYISEHLTWDWDIFYLGATFHVPGVWYKAPECKEWSHRQRDVEPTSDKHILRVFGEWSTYAYLVNGKNAQKVADLLEESCHNSYGIDHNFICLGDKINAYCFVPGSAFQYDHQSDIGDGYSGFSGFKKLGPFVWADYMEDFDPDTYNWNTGVSE